MTPSTTKRSSDIPIVLLVLYGLSFLASLNAGVAISGGAVLRAYDIMAFAIGVVLLTRIIGKRGALSLIHI